MNFFYKIHPDKNFAFVARNLEPTTIRKNISEVYFNKTKDLNLKYYWSIDLVKTSGDDLFSSTFCIRDSLGYYDSQSETRQFGTKAEILHFLTIPTQMFEKTRVTCFVYNRPNETWDQIYRKIVKWSESQIL